VISPCCCHRLARQQLCNVLLQLPGTLDKRACGQLDSLPCTCHPHLLLLAAWPLLLLLLLGSRPHASMLLLCRWQEAHLPRSRQQPLVSLQHHMQLNRIPSHRCLKLTLLLPRQLTQHIPQQAVNAVQGQGMPTPQILQP
jgi:hypothetical protein